MKRSVRILTMALALGLPVAGQCADHGKTADQAAKPMAPAVTADKPSNAASPMDTATEAPAERPPLEGKVVETMDGGGYTYIYLEKKSGEKRWVAVPTMKVKVGDQVQLSPGMEMGKFSSRALKRTFDDIIFSGGPIEKKVPLDDETIKKKAHEGIMKDAKKENGPAPAVENIKVEKASGPNAYTIGEIYQQKGDLAGKDVVVKAKVVKVSTGIMNKNWVHLRDGSGDAQKGTHNLIVTSQDTPAVGDVVTVHGTLYKDKDFGGGYKYEVIMENATIKP